MHERILIAGSGGQGVISIGKLLARLAAETIQHITFFPAYGAEVRGGTSNCQVILSSNEIAAPIAEKFDSLLVMNQQSTDHFMPLLDKNGLAVINQSMCKAHADDRHVLVPATEIADRLGNAKAANFVMLGVWLARKPLIPNRTVENAMATHFPDAPPALIDINIRAFRAGLDFSSSGDRKA
ncbi:MAG: 2-oxoacid:acceptor oxidoreductase family protein [Kiritimatiellae bacterium]|nr:2-oxoacid:acceptor oxidoreductase family protein [Kiritimatiellia bacterium]